MDGSICQIYIAHVTPGGQKRLQQGDFCSDPSVPCTGTVPPCASMPLHHKLKSSETVLPLTSKLNRVTQNLVRGEGWEGTKGWSRNSVEDPTIHLWLSTFLWDQDVYWWAELSVCLALYFCLKSVNPSQSAKTIPALACAANHQRWRGGGREGVCWWIKSSSNCGLAELSKVH